MKQQFCEQCGLPIPLTESGCKSCALEELDEYRIVREYLRLHPNSNAMQIANTTGISISRILRYIKNGSLTMVNDMPNRRNR
ncbi:hypothetical protein NDK47_07125 [Brevibacillus ruminantium]|uniref:MerR family transcriptional regulator n=1 Tax=Brevibacillus ruminantium TaxID=2950604 RepID=A0ABY4WIT1_9BACL|nr:hypothetical protein [Brevibacillus ruminantium]USG67056.1 hypothetical protein NDK47_07125 [Brevibacillus ruminantium]